jgi:hypothetical protein
MGTCKLSNEPAREKKKILNLYYFFPTFALTQNSRPRDQLKMRGATAERCPMKPLPIILFAVVLFGVAPRVAGQVLTSPFTGSYSFVGQTNSVLWAYNGTPIANLEVSALSKIGVTSASAADRFMASQWTVNFDADRYFEFTLTGAPMPGIPFAELDLSSVEFALRRSSSGPRQFQWRSSADDFATPITTFSSLNPSITLVNGILTVPDSASTTTFGGNILSLAGTGFTNQITLRLYAFQTENEFGQAGLDSPLTFSGTLAIPEPTSIALLCLAGALLGGLHWRRRTSR